MSDVQLVKLDWDEECRTDFITGRGFEVKEKAFKSKEEKSLHGIHSPFYATDWDDEDAFSERYSCKCKELKGRVYEGEVCKVCNTKVVFRDVDLNKFGWILLGNNYIIQPIFFNMLETIIGKTMFNEIIEFDKDITLNGVLIEKKSKNPFKGIGLIEFKERFDEIMDYFKAKKKNKRELIDEVLSEREKIFTSSIPVYSSVLRPVSFRNEMFFFNSFDKKYNSIFSLSRLINDNTKGVTRTMKKKKEKLEEPMTLYFIQRKVNELWTLIFSQINQKNGHIREEILGGRINFSSRNVIIPDPTLKADEIKLGYITFLELFKYEIISHLAKMSNCTIHQSHDEWSKATINFDPKIYEIMMYIVKKRKPRVVINRNPTINYGSLLLMKVVEVKREYEDDYTMSLPIQILTVLNADFDGDVLNIISLKTKELKKKFDNTFNPRKNMFVSRNDGLFNNDFNLLKDQLIGLYEFNNI